MPHWGGSRLRWITTPEMTAHVRASASRMVFHTSGARSGNVFVNCPYDRRYAELMRALVFTVLVCGHDPRMAMELDDSGDLRLHKILALIADSAISIHDISRVELDAESGLPRFNMPIELGISLGMKHLGDERFAGHRMLVLDSEPWRYHKTASDLAGTDPKFHANRVSKLVRHVRDFLANHGASRIPTDDAISVIYRVFKAELPAMARADRQTVGRLTFPEWLRHAQAFLQRGTAG
jgi:hypothetical protein